MSRLPYSTNVAGRRLRSFLPYGVILLAVCSVLGCNAVQAQIPDFSGEAAAPAPAGKQIAVLAGGCFWGVDAVFKHVKGVKSVVSGYSGGSAATAHYELTSTGITGQAESVKITYDPEKVSYAQLLKIFFSVAHDPTELNHQGPDTGTQYRSSIFYATDEQKQIAEAYIDQINKAKVFKAPIVTQVVPLKAFYTAEDYHQNYLELHPDNPYIVFNDLPKLRALKQEFPDTYKP